MLLIGLMTGTSLDGIDVCLVEAIDDKFEIKDFCTLKYQSRIREKLKRNIDVKTARLDEICSLNYELGYAFKESVEFIINKNNLTFQDIEYICCHGQTVWHIPDDSGSNMRSTLQLGETQVISVLTGIKVISNFRAADIIAGGQGAPLVPGFEYLYFKNENENVILQNIGGIGNLTYLPKNCSIKDVVAFDTGPGNALIDYLMNKYYYLQYDYNGEMALSGKIIPKLLEELKTDPYIYKKPPKSTGRELYSVSFIDNYVSKYERKHALNSIITTVTEFTVFSICHSYKEFIKDFDKIIVSGGGVHNQYIMNKLKEEFDCVYSINDIMDSKVFADAKEAFAFAVLGYLSLNNRSGNVINATGAKFPVVLGQITLARKE